jgi:hypothetical protein
MAILLRNAELVQVFEAVAAADETRGINRAVEFLTDVKPLWWS